jgi:hypothetical protein
MTKDSRKNQVQAVGNAKKPVVKGKKGRDFKKKRKKTGKI